MTESRLVRCRECGHEWESTASDPRCSDPNDECGRARADVVDSEPSESESQDNTESGTDGTDSTDTDSDTGRSFFFETTSERTGSTDSAPERPSVDDDSDDGDDDESSDDGPDAEIPELDSDDVRPFLVTIFGGPPTNGDEPIPGYFSMNRGEHWAMRDHELDQLSRAYARVGNKYLPYLLAEYTVEGLALLTTATVMAPRIQEDRRRAERRKKAQTDTEANTGNVRSETSRSDSTDVDDTGDDPVEKQLDQLAQNDDDSAGWAAGSSV